MRSVFTQRHKRNPPRPSPKRCYGAAPWLLAVACAVSGCTSMTYCDSSQLRVPTALETTRLCGTPAYGKELCETAATMSATVVFGPEGRVRSTELTTPLHIPGRAATPVEAKLLERAQTERLCSFAFFRVAPSGKACQLELTLGGECVH